MGLNVSKGNMYDFVTHTWNTVKGACPHGCTYCYMKRWGKQREVRLDRRELSADLGEGNFIFVGSSNDMFAEKIDSAWIIETISYCAEYQMNRYLFQTKNPGRLFIYARRLESFSTRPLYSVVATTVETNRWHPDIMADSPRPDDRAKGMENLARFYPRIDRYVTIEPIIDFDLEPMVELIKRCEPKQVNIGADSGNNHLPEPPAEKVLELIDRLSAFTTIHRKRNLGRLGL